MKQWGNVKKDSKNASKTVLRYHQPVDKYRTQVGQFKEKSDHRAEKGQNSFAREQENRRTLKVTSSKPSTNSFILLGIIVAMFFLFIVLLISLMMKKETVL
jgi:hypothetical protein